MINKDIVKGKAKQAEGRAQDAYGSAAGSPEDNIAGKAKVAEGKIQEGFGKAKAEVKRTLNK